MTRLQVATPLPAVRPANLARLAGSFLNGGFSYVRRAGRLRSIGISDLAVFSGAAVLPTPTPGTR